MMRLVVSPTVLTVFNTLTFIIRWVNTSLNNLGFPSFENLQFPKPDDSASTSFIETLLLTKKNSDTFMEIKVQAETLKIKVQDPDLLKLDEDEWSENM